MYRLTYRLILVWSETAFSMEYKNHWRMSGTLDDTLKPVRFPLTRLIIEGADGAVGFLRALQTGKAACPAHEVRS
jgi:hypothetical protein